MNYANANTVNFQTLAQKRRYVPDISYLMAICELNYVRLLRLVPEMRNADIGAHEVQIATDHQDLGVARFEVLERCPYTTVLFIHQPGMPWSDDWHMTVRVCHDAKVAEVINCQSEPRIQAVNDYPNQRMHQPDEKMQVNVFLGEWLRHCLECGHSVEKVVAAR